MTPIHDERRRLLEETALLPENDPRRHEFMALLRDGPESQREEWCDVVAENEDLRLRLLAVESPTGLSGRLQAIRERRNRRLRSRILPLAAAVVLIASLLGFLIVRAEGENLAVHTLAVLSVMDHAARPELTALTDDPDSLSAALRESIPFKLKIPDPGDGAVLTGGRVCSFGNRPLVYTCWQWGDEDVAVYQLQRKQFGLRANMAPHHVDIPEHGSPQSRSRVRVWTDDEFAYVVVHDQQRRTRK